MVSMRDMMLGRWGRIAVALALLALIMMPAIVYLGYVRQAEKEQQQDARINKLEREIADLLAKRGSP